MFGLHISLCRAGLLLFYVVRSLSAQPSYGEKISVGAIFDQNTDEIQNVFKFAMTQHNQNLTRGKLELQAYVDVINTADAFKLSRLICNQFARGVFSMIGAVTPDSFDTLHSYTNTFQMPFITPWFPEKVIPPSSGLIDHAISMRPDYHKAIVDTIIHYGWSEVIYLYDSHDGLLRLQQLYQTMRPGHFSFKITHVKRINSAAEAIEFLLTLEQHNRWENKRIVLDCNAKNAKSVLVAHVRNIYLGRRTYHYLLSGLVMDDHWENEIIEYGAVNITGYRIVDHSRTVVRDFMDGLRKMDPRAKETVSAQAALLYDGVLVVIDALGRLFRKKPEVFRNTFRRTPGQGNNTKVIDCNPGKSWVVPFEHGDKISRLIKKTDIEGLTGNISFNDEGHRHNFTLHVMEMSVDRAIVKVATWSDGNGLTVVPSKFVRMQSPSSIDTNKTYYVTTLLQDQYLMQRSVDYGQPKNEQFYGLCKDLMDIIAQDLGIKYEIHIVRDGRYGEQNPMAKGDWNGLVGEVARKDADIAIAPLIVTKDREEVLDFTEPYVSVDYPYNPNDPSESADAFGFLRPLSKEIWLCVLFSFFAVSIVLFLVSRFSPHEWKSMSITDTNLDRSFNSNTNEIILHNEFSIWNSFWFSLGSFMQQGSDVIPRSLSGRIVGSVWWFFALILVCSYTANLAAYLIISRQPDRFTSYANVPGTAISLTETLHIISENNIQEDALPNSDYMIANDKILNHLMCNPIKNTCNFKHVNFAFAVAKGSPLREPIDLAIIKMKKNEMLTKQLKKWLMKTDRQDCNTRKHNPNNSEITLSQVSGIFYILLGGLVLAMTVALIEFCQHSRIEANRTNVPLRTALRAKARMPCHDRKQLPTSRTPTRDDRLGWNGAAFAGYYAGNNQMAQDEALHASFTHV